MAAVMIFATWLALAGFCIYALIRLFRAVLKLLEQR